MWHCVAMLGKKQRQFWNLYWIWNRPLSPFFQILPSNFLLQLSVNVDNKFFDSNFTNKKCLKHLKNPISIKICKILQPFSVTYDIYEFLPLALNKEISSSKHRVKGLILQVALALAAKRQLKENSHPGETVTTNNNFLHLGSQFLCFMRVMGIFKWHFMPLIVLYRYTYLLNVRFHVILS